MGLTFESLKVSNIGCIKWCLWYECKDGWTHSRVIVCMELFDGLHEDVDGLYECDYFERLATSKKEILQGVLYLQEK